MRLDFVELLLSSESCYFNLEKSLLSFPDLENLVTTSLVQIPKLGVCSSVERCQSLITKILALKKALLSVPLIKEALQEANGECELLLTFINAMQHPGLESSIEEIGRVLTEEAQYEKNPLALQTQRCFCIRPGIDALLDVARQTFNDAIEDIYSLADQYRDEFDIPSLKVAHSARRGFHLTAKSSATLPSVALQQHTKGTLTSFTTEDLASLHQRQTDATAEIYLLSAKIMEDLVESLRKYISVFLTISDCISLIDCLRSFAQHISTSPLDSFKRPVFNQQGAIAIKDGRHPLSCIFSPDSFVANNTMLSKASPFCILSGPNMSGKSVYLRQVALIAILAHVGCWTPAAHCSMPEIDRIFSRIGTSDDIQSNSSTFFSEMREMSNILANATSRSLILIDELGRGTSNHDGVGIAFSCAEYLISLSALTIFTTHYCELHQLATIYPKANNYHLKVTEDGDKLTFLHKVEKGCNPSGSYGLYAAESAGFPQQVLQSAKEVRSLLQKRNSESPTSQEINTSATKVLLAIGSKMKNLVTSNLSESEIRALLLELKQQTIAMKNLNTPPAKTLHTTPVTNQRNGEESDAMS